MAEMTREEFREKYPNNPAVKMARFYESIINYLWIELGELRGGTEYGQRLTAWRALSDDQRKAEMLEN